MKCGNAEEGLSADVRPCAKCMVIPSSGSRLISRREALMSMRKSDRKSLAKSRFTHRLVSLLYPQYVLSGVLRGVLA